MRNQNPRNVYRNFMENKIPEMRYDGTEDLTTWQHRTRAKLADLLGLDTFSLCDPDFLIESQTETDEYWEIRFSFQTEVDYYAVAVLRLPKNITGKISPMICLQGHSTGMHISLGQPKFPGDEETINGGDRDFAVHALKNGYAPVALEQRYMGECGGNEKTGNPSCFPSFEFTDGRSAMPTLLAGRTSIGERIWDVSRLIDVLEAEFPQLDMDNVMLLIWDLLVHRLKRQTSIHQPYSATMWMYTT